MLFSQGGEEGIEVVPAFPFEDLEGSAETVFEVVLRGDGFAFGGLGAGA